MSAKKIGVYVCQCGGNIGDYVDVNEVVAAVEKEQGVARRQDGDVHLLGRDAERDHRRRAGAGP